jgi:hypothetical protein
MRAFPNTFSAQSSAETAVAETAETEVLKLVAGGTQSPNTKVIIDGTVNLLIGKEATAVVVRIRRSSLTGTVVLTQTTTMITAEKQASISFNAEDEPGEVAGVTYIVSVQQTAGKAAGTMKFAALNVSY